MIIMKRDFRSTKWEFHDTELKPTASGVPFRRAKAGEYLIVILKLNLTEKLESIRSRKRPTVCNNEPTRRGAAKKHQPLFS